MCLDVRARAYSIAGSVSARVRTAQRRRFPMNTTRRRYSASTVGCLLRQTEIRIKGGHRQKNDRECLGHGCHQSLVSAWPSEETTITWARRRVPGVCEPVGRRSGDRGTMRPPFGAISGLAASCPYWPCAAPSMGVPAVSGGGSWRAQGHNPADSDSSRYKSRRRSSTLRHTTCHRLSLMLATRAVNTFITT